MPKKSKNIFVIFERLLKEYLNGLIADGYYIDYEKNETFVKYAKYIYNKINDYEKSLISLTNYQKKGDFFNFVLTKYVILKEDSPNYKEYVEKLFNKLYTIEKWWKLKDVVIKIINHRYFKRIKGNDDTIYLVNKIIHKNKVYILFPNISKQAIIKINKGNISNIFETVKTWTLGRKHYSDIEINSIGEKTYQYSYLINIYNTTYKDNIHIRIDFDASQYKEEMYEELCWNWQFLYEFEDLNDEIKKIEDEIDKLLKKDYTGEINEIKSRIAYYKKKLLLLNFNKKVAVLLDDRIHSTW